MSDETHEVMALSNTSLTDITDDIIASAERRIGSVEKIVNLSLKITNEQDWVDQNGKPYLTSSGAEKIARLFGVCWSNIKTEKIMTEDENGRFYFYQTAGVFSLRNDKVEAVGTCSSHDQFFALRWQGEGENRKKVLLPMSEVDETNIMKASYSNCITNGITRLLGLRNLTWAQVQKAGIQKEKVSAVKYAEGGQGGGKISEAQGKRLFAILMKGADGDQIKVRQDLLKKFIVTTYKIEHTKDIERKDYDAIVKQAEAIAEMGTVGA